MTTDSPLGLIAKDSKLEIASDDLTGSFGFDNVYKHITRASGSFITDGIKVGQTLYTDDEDNPGPLTVTEVSALAITVAEALTHVDAASKTITAWNEVKEVISMATPSGEPDEIEMTHLRSPVKQFRNGLRDEGSISGEMNFIPDDDGQNLLRAMSAQSTARRCKISVPATTDIDGYSWEFDALGRGTPAAINTGQRITQTFTLRVTSLPTETVLEAL